MILNLNGDYPGNYFEHWLAMFSLYQTEWANENIEAQINMYMAMEGEEEYSMLKEEIKEVIKNQDLPNFLKFAKKHSSPKLKIEDMERMVELIMRGNS